MAINRYSGFLTVLLVIIVIAIFAGVGILAFNFFTRGESVQDVMGRFEDAARENENNNEEVPDIEGTTPNGGTGRGQGRNRTMCCCGRYVAVGIIEIPRTNVRYPILERGTNRSLDIAVAVMWPDNPEPRINEPGNVTIMGHNYRNGRFFSNNGRLSLGDTIIITDVQNRRVTYTIYEIFETTPEDTSFLTRDTGGRAEVTLTTCTDDGSRRIIVQARAN